MKFSHMLLMAGTLTCLSGCYGQPSETDVSAYQATLQADAARRESAWAESDTLMKQQNELQKRYEALLAKQEEQARRFDAILEKWESLPTGGNN